MKISRIFKGGTTLPITWIGMFGIFHQLTQVSAFPCYKCSSNEMKLCIEDPTELPPSSAVDCEGFCTILRTEYTEIPGKVITLIRDCSQEEPLVANGVRTEKHYTKMYTSCDSELCNSGDGQREPGDEDNPDGVGPMDIIKVPETASGPMVKPLCLLVGVFSFFALFIS